MPTRSPGCYACRRRKIGCDQTRPGCKKCAIHGIECPGYRSDTDKTFNVVIYRAETEATKPRSPPKPVKRGSPDSLSRSPSNASSIGTLSTSTGTLIASPVPPYSSPNEYGLPQPITCAPQNRLQVVSIAMSKLVPSGTFTSVPLDLMDISPFYFMQINQPVLVAAMDTLALVQLGTAFKDPSIVMQAKRSYGRSLRLLMQTVSLLQPEECWDEQIVSAVLITALSGSFDALHTESSYIMHSAGLQSLLLARGPFPLSTPFEAMVFLQARQILTYQNAITHQRCFLEAPEWMAVSASSPCRDSHWDIQDIGVTLPGIFERSTVALKEADPRQIFSVIRELDGFLLKLDTFQDNLPPQETMRQLCDIQSFSTVYSWLDEDRTISQVFDYSDWRFANAFSACLMYRALALSSLVFILKACASSGLPLSLDDLGRDLEVAMLDLCRIVPALIGDDPSFLGMIAVSPVLRCVIVYFEKNHRRKEFAWCMKLIAKVNEAGVAYAGSTLW